MPYGNSSATDRAGTPKAWQTASRPCSMDVEARLGKPITSPTAYMLGMLEIQNARAETERRLGAKFDIRRFHDVVLEDGAVPVTFLTAKIAASF